LFKYFGVPTFHFIQKMSGIKLLNAKFVLWPNSKRPKVDNIITFSNITDIVFNKLFLNNTNLEEFESGEEVDDVTTEGFERGVGLGRPQFWNFANEHELEHGF